MGRPAVFLDRDGTISLGAPHIERVDSVDKVSLLPNTLAALKLLAGLDYPVFIVTNQAGLAEGLIGWPEFEAINAKVLQLIEPSGLQITRTYVCPHGESDDCDCRKPKPKLLLDAAAEYDIDLAASWMIGDRPSDVMTGVNAGTKTILVMTGFPDAVAPQADYTCADLLEAIRYIAAQ